MVENVAGGGFWGFSEQAPQVLFETCSFEILFFGYAAS
jgi:hypothetical protein